MAGPSPIPLPWFDPISLRVHTFSLVGYNIFCPRQKKLSPGHSKSEVHWYFYVPKRERESKSEHKSEREREKEKEREKERERTKVQAIIFVNLMDQTEKSVKY
jgi:hypothetical protein